VFTIKSDHGLSEARYDKIIEWAWSILLEGNKLKENFYAAKSMIKPLGLGYQKIDMCLNFYMLYYPWKCWDDWVHDMRALPLQTQNWQGKDSSGI
jgi:hypothetical protein